MCLDPIKPWRRFRPGLEMLVSQSRLFGLRKGLKFWWRWTRMRWNTPTANFGPSCPRRCK
jgi:hypothetical protein